MIFAFFFPFNDSLLHKVIKVSTGNIWILSQVYPVV